MFYYKHKLLSKYMGISCDIDIRWMTSNTFDNNSILVQVRACFVPSKNKPLPEPKLTKIYIAICRQWATIIERGGDDEEEP